jgi:hypothetical protein
LEISSQVRHVVGGVCFLVLVLPQFVALLSNKSSQALHNRLVIFRRVSRYTPKRSNTSDPNRQLLIAELINCMNETIGDMPFLIQLKLAKGEVDAEKENGPPDPLQQSGSHVGLKVEPLIY